MKVNIKNTVYKVEFVKSIDNGNYLGLTRKYQKEIFITKDQPKTEIPDTVAHELIHAYIHECGHNLEPEDEEAIATFIGRIFAEMAKNYEKILKGVPKQ